VRACPRDGNPLAARNSHGVEIDVCPECDGVWFDEGELETLSPGGGDGRPLAESVLLAGLRETRNIVPRAFAVRRCPACTGDLVPRYFRRGRSRFAVSLCTRCRGVWLDRAMMRRMSLRTDDAPGARKESATARSAPAAKAPTTVSPHASGTGLRFGLPMRPREWFVALTGMPLDVGNPCRIFPAVTWALILANIAVFLLPGITGRNPGVFFSAYGLDSASLVRGEYYRLLSAMFLHGDFFHLAGNLFFLHTFGDNLEEEYGGLRYLLLYLVCGILAGLASCALATDASGDVIRVGASGAISGVLGTYLVTFPRTRILAGGLILRFIPLVIRWPVWAFLAFWVGLNVVGFVMQNRFEIYAVDYVAHLAGIVCGLVAGLLLVVSRRAGLIGPEA